MKKPGGTVAVRGSRLSVEQRFRRFWKQLWTQRALLFLCIPAVIIIIVYKYGPMYGLVVSLKKFSASAGIWGSPFLDPPWQNFTRFFNTPDFWPVIWQTLKVGVLGMLFTYPMPIIFALFLNELRVKWFKRTVQTISYLPYFISIVVVITMFNNFGALDGLFNQIRGWFGLMPVNMNAGTDYFMFMYIGSAIWQGMGYGSIIYLSALSNVDPSLYDVANIDGAGRWKKMRHIALPSIIPTSMVILILNTGSILVQDYTKILLLQNDTNRRATNVISTLVYRAGLVEGNFEYATAINLFVGVISCLLVVGTNMIVRRISPENSMW